VEHIRIEMRQAGKAASGSAGQRTIAGMAGGVVCEGDDDPGNITPVREDDLAGTGDPSDEAALASSFASNPSDSNAAMVLSPKVASQSSYGGSAPEAGVAGNSTKPPLSYTLAANPAAARAVTFNRILRS
jgi:hypothetical protein